MVAWMVAGWHGSDYKAVNWQRIRPLHGAARGVCPPPSPPTTSRVQTLRKIPQEVRVEPNPQ